MPVKNNTKHEINKTISFLIEEKRYKEINIIKEIYYLYTKHHKTLLKETKEWVELPLGQSACLA